MFNYLRGDERKNVGFNTIDVDNAHKGKGWSTDFANLSLQ